MYANLRVTVERDGKRITWPAWRISGHADGHTTVHLDAQDGTGKYPEADGLRRIEADEVFTVEADF